MTAQNNELSFNMKDFNDYAKANGVEKAFDYYDKYIKTNNIVLSNETIEDFISNEEYTKYYEKLCRKLKLIDPLYDFSSYKNRLLGNILELYDLSITVDDDELEIVPNKDNKKHETVLTEDALHDYLVAISKIPLLSKEEEKDLFTRRDNGEDLNNLLVESNLKLAVHVAKKYRYRARKMSLLDLINEGNIGLIKAVEKFDVTKGFKFSTYAMWWIRQAITRSIADKDSTIRLPVHVQEDFNKIDIFRSRQLQSTNKEASLDEVSAATNLTVERIKEIDSVYEKYSSTLSFDVPVGEDEDSSLVDFMSNNDYETILINTEFTQFKELFKQMSGDVLTPREKEILELRYGLVDGVERTLEDTGKIIGVTRERIRQIENKAINKLTRANSRRNNDIDKLNSNAKNISSNKSYDSSREFYDFKSRISNKFLKITGFKTIYQDVHVECMKCGYEFDIRALDLQKNSSCSKCRQLRYESLRNNGEKINILDKVLEKTNGTVSVTNLNADSKTLELKCDLCNNIWKTSKTSIADNCQCSNCKISSRKIDMLYEQATIEYRLEDSSNGLIELSKFRGLQSVSTLHCKNCNNLWNVPPFVAANGTECPKCRGIEGLYINNYSKRDLTQYDIDRKEFNKLLVDLSSTNVYKIVANDFNSAIALVTLARVYVELKKMDVQKLVSYFSLSESYINSVTSYIVSKYSNIVSSLKSEMLFTIDDEIQRRRNK